METGLGTGLNATCKRSYTAVQGSHSSATGAGHFNVVVKQGTILIVCVCIFGTEPFVLFFFQQAVKKRLHDLLVVMQQVLILWTSALFEP